VTQLNSAQATGQPQLERSGYARIVQVLFGALVYAVLLFVSAGRLDYIEAWAFLLIYLGSVTVNFVLSLRSNPDVINERGKIARNSRGWDLVIVTLYSILLLAQVIVAGFDAGRFGWSHMPLVLEIVGGAGLLTAMAIVAWTMQSNPFLATTVRIQSERGHRPVTTGPYSLIRHPMYLGTIIMGPSIGFLLGSWWAVIAGLAVSILFILRTALEDSTLQKELPGYAEYAGKIRFRLLPGVW
jgi:protein-S-isoprenylcysteine O-methyltransferase Ste14